MKITQADTFISGPEGNPQEINHRIEELRVSISKNSSPTSLMILKVYLETNLLNKNINIYF